MTDAALVKKCPDCQVEPGVAHKSGCDVARCLVSGGQRLACEPQDHPSGSCGWDVWTGEWPEGEPPALPDAPPVVPPLMAFVASLSTEERSGAAKVTKLISGSLSASHTGALYLLSVGLTSQARGKLTVRERQLLDAYFARVQENLLALLVPLES